MMVFGNWLLIFLWYHNVCFLTMCSSVVNGFLHIEISFPFFVFLVEWIMLFALDVQMLYLFGYHGQVNLSHWQFLSVELSIYGLVQYYHFVLLEVLVGFVLSSVCVYILKYCLHWTLLTIILCGIVVWFFAVGLFSCRCLVDLPGVKTLLLTNQQHQLLKGLVYHLRHLKIQMRIDSDFRLTHMPTQMCSTSQPL